MDDYSDEFHSDDQDSLIPKKSAASPRVKGKKGKSKNYRSAGSSSRGKGISGWQTGKSARELWLSAVHTSGGTNAGRKKDHPSKRTTTEFWTDTLRRTGHGISTESTASSFTGLKKSHSGNMAYHSTSHYLRQAAGTESGRRSGTGDTITKPAPGTPAYKSPEEYYDTIMEMKRVIKSLEKDNSTMKSKLRRLEEDNLKKEKEIEQLLDPSKSDELRRTLADRKPDAGAVIHSHKQKIMKLEQQLKDKEAAHSKLQSDLKTTKIEEMKIQVEYFYKEILRLKEVKSTETTVRRKESSTKENPSKLKALQEMVKRMNEKNLRTQTENQTLKKDLNKMMEEKEIIKTKKGEYENMSKKELLTVVTKLERRLDRAEGDTSSLVSDLDSRRNKPQGKIVLEGSVEQKLHQLDQRETELLKDLEKKQQLNKRLKDDRAHYRQKSDEKDVEIKRLTKEVEELQAELSGFDRSRGRSRTPRRDASPHSARQETSPRQRSRSRSASMSSAEKERLRQVEQFTENHAARSIQKGWKQHQRRQYEDDAAETIQSAMRGHQARKGGMERLRGYYVESEEDDRRRYTTKKVQRQPKKKKVPTATLR